MLRTLLLSVAAVSAFAGAQSDLSPQEAALQNCIETKATAHFNARDPNRPAQIKKVVDACQAKTAAFAKSEGLPIDVASKRVAVEADRQLGFLLED